MPRAHRTCSHEAVVLRMIKFKVQFEIFFLVTLWLKVKFLQKNTADLYIFTKIAFAGLTAIHLSLICMTVRLRWTDCHTFVSYLYDSKA